MLFISRLLYDIVIRIYYVGVWVMAHIVKNTKAKAWITGRKQLWNDLAQVKHDKPITWFHCASVGEFEQAKPLIDKLKAKHPEYQIIVTFFSPSGYEVVVNKGYADHVQYLPFDFKTDVVRFLDQLRPDVAFIIKYEFWYHLLHETQQRNIPLYSVCSYFTPSSIFFKWHGGLNRHMLGFFTQLFVQDQSSKDLLSSIGIDKVQVVGDTRFDRVNEIAKAEFKHPIIEQFCKGQKIFIAGSVWPSDEHCLIPFIKKAVVEGNHKFIFAPHNVTPLGIDKLLKAFGSDGISLSQASESSVNNHQILIIDSYGILSRLYRYGHIVYIGGGFGIGVHNILEPVVYGLPTLFGPNFQRFKEATDLVAKGGAFSVNNVKESQQVFENLQEGEYYNKVSMINHSYTQENIGATDRIYQQVTASFDGTGKTTPQ